MSGRDLQIRNQPASAFATFSTRRWASNGLDRRIARSSGFVRVPKYGASFDIDERSFCSHRIIVSKVTRRHQNEPFNHGLLGDPRRLSGRNPPTSLIWNDPLSSRHVARPAHAFLVLRRAHFPPALDTMDYRRRSTTPG